MEPQIGEVQFFNSVRGYGFIAGPSGIAEFFHITDVLLINGARIVPSRGDLFLFESRPCPRKPGFTEAFNLRRIKHRVPDTLVKSAKEIADSPLPSSAEQGASHVK